jgi:hypothetical protein
MAVKPRSASFPCGRLLVESFLEILAATIADLGSNLNENPLTALVRKETLGSRMASVRIQR